MSKKNSNTIGAVHDLHKSVNQVKNLLKLYIGIKKPLMIHGGPGVGKSDAVHQVGQELDRPVIDFRASLAGAEDIKGYPYLEAALDIAAKQEELKDELEKTHSSNKEKILQELKLLDQEKTKQVMKFAIASDLPRDPNSKAILFLDEVNLAPPSTQSALYQLILNRKIGEYTLPQGVDIVAAGNREEDRGNIHEMSKPLDNRFGHVIATVDADEWLHWARDNNIHVDIQSYIKANPHKLYAFDPESPSHAFATPRSWATASALLHELEKKVSLKSEDGIKQVFEAIASAIGMMYAPEFKAWIMLTNKLPSPASICGGENPKISDDMELGLRYALVLNCLNYIVAEAKKYIVDVEKDWDNFTKQPEYTEWTKKVSNYLRFTYDNDKMFGAEYVALFTDVFVRQNKFRPDLSKDGVFNELLKKYQPELSMLKRTSK